MERKRNTFLAVTRTVTPEGKRLLEMHRQGKSTAEMAAEFECVQSTIIRALHSLGVKLSRGRPVGARDRRPRQVKQRKASAKTPAAAAAAESSSGSGGDRAPAPAVVHETFRAAGAAA